MECRYFPGCSLHGTAKEYGQSLGWVAPRLGIELRELEDWSCCGATAARSLSATLPLVLAARNLAMAEKAASPLLVACNLCYSNLAVAAHSLRDEAVRKGVNSTLQPLGLSYAGEAILLHPLQAIHENVDLQRLSELAVRPLRGLKVVSYYGCLLTRPRQASIPDSNFNPLWMDFLIAALGAEPLPFSAKTKCCGGPLLMTHPEATVAPARKLLDEARELGAHCIAVSCPQCHTSLGDRQRTIERITGTRYDMPVLYFTQLLGLAFGGNAAELGLSRRLASRLQVVDL